MDICLDGIQPPKVLTQSSTVVTPSRAIAQHGSQNETGIGQSSVPDQDILKNLSESRDIRFGDIVAIGAGTTALPRSTWAHAHHVTVFDDNDMKSDSEHPAQDTQSSWFAEQEQTDWLAFDLGWLQPQDPATAGDAQHVPFHRSFYIHNQSALDAFGSPKDILESSLAQAETSIPYAGVVHGESFRNLAVHRPDAHLGDRREKCPIATCDYHAKGFARSYDRHRHTRTYYQGRHGLDRSVRERPSNRRRGSSDKTDDQPHVPEVFSAENYLACASAVLAEVSKMMPSTADGALASLGLASHPNREKPAHQQPLGSSEGIPAAHILAIQG